MYNVGKLLWYGVEFFFGVVEFRDYIVVYID